MKRMNFLSIRFILQILENLDDEEVGFLIINHKNKSYEFSPSGRWKGEDIIPLHVYGLPDSEYVKLATTIYANSRFGGGPLILVGLLKN